MNNITKESLKIIDANFDETFESLYWDLYGIFGTRLEWIGYLSKPPWWRLRSRRFHKIVALVFARHGLVLDRYSVFRFFNAPPQGSYGMEDRGGFIIRKLRHGFQHQSGIPWETTETVYRKIDDE